MLTKLKIKIRSSLLLQKILWTIFIIFIYMLGRTLPVTTVPLNVGVVASTEMSDLLDTLASVTGGQLSSITLFSLGLSPWMTAMIIWRFLTLFDTFKQMTSNRQFYYRTTLTLLIALLQAFGLTSTSTFNEIVGLGSSSALVARIATMTIMIGGAFVLVWLGNMNGAKGLGGPTTIIIVNMMLAFFTNVSEYFGDNNLGTNEIIVQLIIFAVSLFLLIMMTVITYRAEYRIPMKRIGLVSEYTDSAYIPIRVTPAGGMPFMYGMTLMMLPPVILASLLNFFPDNLTLQFLAQNMSISRLPGVITYLILLYILAIGFAYYNYDPTDIAKNMQENGDYIEHVRPGKPTAKFIQRKLNVLTQVGAIFSCTIGTGPLLVMVLLGENDKASLALLVSNVFIVASLLLGVVEQVDMLRTWKKYGPVL